jgi:hypothetical protein
MENLSSHKQILPTTEYIIRPKHVTFVYRFQGRSVTKNITIIVVTPSDVSEKSTNSVCPVLSSNLLASLSSENSILPL